MLILLILLIPGTRLLSGRTRLRSSWPGVALSRCRFGVFEMRMIMMVVVMVVMMMVVVMVVVMVVMMVMVMVVVIVNQ